MRPDFFHEQWQRLIVRFGAKAMDDEFKMLCAREVHDMSEPGLKRAIDIWIGSRTSNKPPLLSEFREARVREQKLKFENDVRGAAQTIFKHSPEEMRKHLRAILSKEFGGVETVADALEIAKHRLRIARAERGEDGQR